MLITTSVLSLLLAVLLFLAIKKLSRITNEYRRKGLLKPWPIATVRLEQLDSIFKPGPHGIGLGSQVDFLSGPYPGGVSALESWILCVLAKTANTIFEFGTCTGRTTYLLATNSDPEAKIITLTLHPEDINSYKKDTNDDDKDGKNAKNESAYSEFFYHGTQVEHKIEQLFCDSKAYNETNLQEKCDVIFIDGSHTASYVKSDSEKAIKMLKPGGVVLWHDYRGPYLTKGVFQYLNQLAETLPLKHLKDTSMVYYRKPQTPI